MAGLASRDQFMAAKAVIDCLTALDKVTRLDAGTPTEITGERTVEDVDAEFARIVADVEAGRG